MYKTFFELLGAFITWIFSGFRHDVEFYLGKPGNARKGAFTFIAIMIAVIVYIKTFSRQ